MVVSVRVFVVMALVLGVSFVVEFDEGGGGFSGEAAELDEVEGQVGDAIGPSAGQISRLGFWRNLFVGPRFQFASGLAKLWVI